MELANIKYKVPKHNYPKPKNINNIYTIKRQTEDGEVIEIKPEVLEIIRKRLQMGEDIRN